jgi:hypothetical protein
MKQAHKLSPHPANSYSCLAQPSDIIKSHRFAVAWCTIWRASEREIRVRGREEQGEMRSDKNVMNLSIPRLRLPPHPQVEERVEPSSHSALRCRRLDNFSFNYEKFPSNNFLSVIICLARLALGRNAVVAVVRTHPPACTKPQ